MAPPLGRAGEKGSRRLKDLARRLSGAAAMVGDGTARRWLGKRERQ